MYTKYAQKLADSLRPCESMISTLLETIEKIESAKEENRNENEYLNNSNKFRAYLQDHYNEVVKINAIEFFDDFTEITEYISTFEENVKLIQERDRFYPQASDKFILKVRKLWKRFFLKINWSFISGINFIRGLFKKTAIPKQFWNHKVKEQQLAGLVYRVIFLEKLNLMFADVLQYRQEIFQRIKAIDCSIEAQVLLKGHWKENDFKNELRECAEDIKVRKKEIELFFNELKKELDEYYKKLQKIAGTIEFPSRKFKTGRVTKKANRQIKIQNGLLNNFERRAFALFEHWRLVYEIRFANLSVTDHFNSKEKELKRVFDEVLVKKDTAFVELLESAFEKIAEKKDLAHVQDELLSRELLKEGIPAYIEKLMETDFVTHLEELKNTCKEEFGNTKANYLLPSKKSWDKDPGVPKLRATNVLDIVRGCLAESVEENIVKQKTELISGIQLSLSNAEELTGVVEYALEYYNTKDVEDEADQHAEFTNGIERAIKKAKENKQHDRSLSSTLEDELGKINSSFIGEITNAISLDNLNQKQTEMIRKKRIRDARNILITGLVFGKELFTKSHTRVLGLIKQAREKYTAYREVLGLSDKSETIGSELSNYLSETEKAIARLPLMYQRLFKITPLTNAKFRIERPQVIQQLETAYSNWTNGKFAPTCLVGETGSGMTSTVNIFEERFSHQYTFYRFNMEYRIVTENDFIQFMKVVFTDVKFESLDELIEEINKLKGRRVVVIENVQQLFIRKMNGFNNLSLFFKLISQTNSKVFWLSTCLLYTFKYLDHTMKMHDYYGHVINLDTLNKDDITDVITKRHKFSGFKLNFLEPNNFNPKRGYKRMSNSQKQVYLQEDYFKRLYNYSQNNLSLALLFWMRSIVNVEDNVFDLQYRHLDYSFFTSLSNIQVVSLHSFLLHGSLSLDEHADILGWQKEESFAHLMVFVDDGILMRKENYYLINPLVYRQLVNHLDVLNYVH